ncbi:P-loop containing nucleoside triphosphate hydrolase protein [Pisolithus sp. B1]|nr:P-loop containing nucleoside triphosphate hydrolase protein [Pisolithus sp. B1]
MRVALHFDNADGFGEWRILIGTNAIRKLKEFRRSDAKKFKTVYKKIKELSCGVFSDENQKRLDGVPSGVPIFEANIPSDLMLVYQIDCVPDRESKTERQVIKIYGIYPRTQLNAVWDAMSHHLSGRGEEYIQRCIFRNKPVHPGSKVYLPAMFPLQVAVHEVVAKPPSLVLSEQEMNDLHSLLVLDKYITFSQALLSGLIAKNDVQHVFELTPQEREIVECTTSCYVQGRSGTGKTTVMLFRMLRIQREWQLRSEGSDIPRPRQIFVTKSHVLANKVQEYFEKLLESLSLAGCTLGELARSQPRHVDHGLVDNDDVPDTQGGIPLRYSELEDRHFPLFLTFDRLARMIAADILDADDPEAKRIAKLFMQSDDPDALDSFVSYDVFINRYWPHFHQKLTRGLDPWLVFGEIIGIIKGSEKSLGFDNGSLDRKTYYGLPSRSNPTFSGQRKVVYDIYKAYSKLKCQRQHHDVADRTHAVLKALLGGTPLKGPQVDFLYVDEAQDNLLIDALLLRLICSNLEGLFWAGDTAQTISAGSSFRFEDLKAFLHRIEVDQDSRTARKRIASSPKSFQLTINYRSHGGIVNCAHSVIELISRFWPNSIDPLQPERGIVNGLKPVFFSGWDKDIAGYEQFLFGASGGRVEFGAQQCILVRDENAKEKLRQQVGDIGLFMTLYESKGLEFNDVLLYNFFEDSKMDLSRWRLVLAAIDGVVEGRNKSQLRAPCFERDESRYVGVCGELKLLYVGITRARKNMWIVDKPNKAEPMRLFWTSRSQIQNCTPTEDLPRLAVSSTPEEWAETGRSLFHHKRYTQAMHCFRRANMPREVRIAEAYHFRELARATVGTTQLSEQRRAFAKAADAFVNCGNEAPSWEQQQYHRIAAVCYAHTAEDHKDAAVGDRKGRGQGECSNVA